MPWDVSIFTIRASNPRTLVHTLAVTRGSIIDY
jgi:hypothetical protein